MSDETAVEHHWHAPTQGQITKAMFQMLAEMGVTKEALMPLVEKKVEGVLSNRVNELLQSKRFDDLIVAAVASHIRNDKEVFDRKGGYGLVNHVRDLIRQQLAQMLTDGYEVIVRPKVRG